MEPINYFQHDYRSRLDKKLLKIRKKHGMTGVGVYWSLVEMLHEGSGFIEMDAETIAYELQCDEQIVKDVIEICFDYFEDNVTCNRVIENLQFRREKASAKSKQGTDAVNVRWEKYRASLILSDTDSIPLVYEPNTQPIPNHTIEKEKEKEKEIDIDIDKGKVISYSLANKLLADLCDWSLSFSMFEEALEEMNSIGFDKLCLIAQLPDSERVKIKECVSIRVEQQN